MAILKNQPPSKYCQFHMALIGYDIYSRLSGKKLYKFDVFNNYNRPERESELELIKARMYPGFDFIENENHPSHRSAV